MGSPRILEWVAYPFSSGSSWSRNRTRVSCIAGGLFTNWTIRVALFYYFFLNFTLFYFTILCWFCHTSTWICHRCTCVPNPEPPSPYHLSGSSQCTSPKHPVSCIEPRLAIRFLHDIIHVSMPFSLVIPPSPSPTESKILFYTSVFLLLSHIQGYHYRLSKFHIYVLVYCTGVFLSGLLHSIIGSSFIHLIRTDSNVFFLMAE